MHDPDIWDDSAENSLAEMISDQIKNMPDRPKIVVSVFNWNMERTQRFGEEMAKFKQAALRVFRITYLTIPADVGFLGFDGDSFDASLSDFLTMMSLMPIDEAIVYVEGVAKLRIAPTKAEPSSAIPN